MHAPSFEGYCYNYKKYEHRAFECRSKSMWAPKKLEKKKRFHGYLYNWVYNSRKIYHYCQECGHILENWIRTHFNGNYIRWLSQTTCFSYLKIGHISKHFQTRSKEPNSKFKKGKGKVDIEHTKGEMKKKWKKRDDCSTSNRVGITSSNRSSGHTSSN